MDVGRQHDVGEVDGLGEGQSRIQGVARRQRGHNARLAFDTLAADLVQELGDLGVQLSRARRAGVRI